MKKTYVFLAGIATLLSAIGSAFTTKTPVRLIAKASVSHTYGILSETDGVYRVTVFTNSNNCNTVFSFTCSFSWTSNSTISQLTASRVFGYTTPGKFE